MKERQDFLFGVNLTLTSGRIIQETIKLSVPPTTFDEAGLGRCAVSLVRQKYPRQVESCYYTFLGTAT